MSPCPQCGAPARHLRLLRHRWLLCAACGCASREGRATPAEAGLYFRRPDPAVATHELSELDGWLAQAGIVPRGAVLDVGGGPGFAAAGLQQRAGVERVLLLEYSPHAREHAAGLGVEVAAFDFEGPPLDRVVAGRFDLLLLRYAIAWCRDAARLAAGLAAVAQPGAALVLTWALPTRGALWISAHERAAPAVLWSAPRLEAVFAQAGWSVAHRFEPAPPLRYPHAAWRAALALPHTLALRGLPLEFRQLHAGLVLRRAAEGRPAP